MSPFQLKNFKDFREMTEWSSQFLFQLQTADVEGKKTFSVSISTPQYCLIDYACGGKEMDEILAWLKVKNAKETLGCVKQEDIFKPLVVR